MQDIVAEGLNLAIYGMGTVFVFLTMLVGATVLMSWLVSKTTAETPAALVPSRQTTNARQMAAVTAAVHAHRNRPVSG